MFKIRPVVRKEPKEELTVKEEEVWICDLGSIQGLMCSGGRWFPAGIEPLSVSPNILAG